MVETPVRPLQTGISAIWSFFFGHLPLFKHISSVSKSDKGRRALAATVSSHARFSLRPASPLCHKWATRRAGPARPVVRGASGAPGSLITAQRLPSRLPSAKTLESSCVTSQQWRGQTSVRALSASPAMQAGAAAGATASAHVSTRLLALSGLCVSALTLRAHTNARTTLPQ